MPEFTLSALDGAMSAVDTLHTALLQSHPAIRMTAATISIEFFDRLRTDAARDLEALFSPEP